MEENKELIPELNADLAINLPGEIAADDLLQQLTDYINHLIVRDFHQLVSILYRLDVSEDKLKQMLTENDTEDAGKIIAALIIERQLQKIKSRREYSRRDDTIDEDEKW
jgi:hypothetical protein